MYNSEFLTNINNSEECTSIYIMEKYGNAFCMLSYYPTEHHIIYISNLNVSESKRKNGYGKSIIEYAIEFSKKLGCEYLYLNVLENNWIYEWYKRLGFVAYKKSGNGYDMFLKVN